MTTPTITRVRGIATEQIRRACRRHGITHDDIARAALPPVSRTSVTHWFAGRVVSRNIRQAAERVIAQQDAGAPA